MILQTQASILTRLMTTDCRTDRAEFIDAVQDALVMARESSLKPIDPATISNDRTTLKHHR
ncbi:hypothetical protein [Litorimonas sp. WD9-15]|uniref:hypothetical protein n=1 Tax=Litorimonas sp. WD9-15 TaxID=3418716 RepID=UPI003CFF8CD8